MSEKMVDVHVHAQVCHIKLSQPASRNALSKTMIDALSQALEHAIDDQTVRVIVFTAEGNAFCAGGNLGNINERLTELAGPDGRDPIALGNRAYGRFLERLAECPKPTVALVHGAAMGGGAGLACTVDIVIALRESKFGFPETAIGLVPAQILPFVANRIGLQHARRMMLTGERLSADDAIRVGLVDYLEHDMDTAQQRLIQVTESLLRGGPKALAQTKCLLRTVFDMQEWQESGLSSYLDDAADVFASQLRTEALEGIAAAKEKREPVW